VDKWGGNYPDNLLRVADKIDRLIRLSESSLEVRLVFGVSAFTDNHEGHHFSPYLSNSGDDSPDQTVD
jgi:hypothetical protein